MGIKPPLMRLRPGRLTLLTVLSYLAHGFDRQFQCFCSIIASDPYNQKTLYIPALKFYCIISVYGLA